ncbi:hypothetical protein BY996DRAFT_6527756 [Phakopsora pachyrhizi]|nr:hypothetical protein BY996DRAFT_6527756 [Phakopsora pachyrhizi]
MSVKTGINQQGWIYRALSISIVKKSSSTNLQLIEENFEDGEEPRFNKNFSTPEPIPPTYTEKDSLKVSDVQSSEVTTRFEEDSNSHETIERKDETLDGAKDQEGDVLDLRREGSPILTEDETEELREEELLMKIEVERSSELEPREVVMESFLGAVAYKTITSNLSYQEQQDSSWDNSEMECELSVKVGNFGLEILFKFKGNMQKMIFNVPNYIAPEIIFNQTNRNSFEADIWSVNTTKEYFWPTTEDYSIICMWLSKPSNFSACFGRPPASKENGYALMAAEVNQKSKSGLNISSKQMKERFKTYKAKYVKAKKMGDSTGFGVSEDDQSKGIITISQKLNNLCPCFEQMDVIFGSQPNIIPPSVADTCKNSIETVTMVDEHIDENLPNLGESSFDNAGYSQNNTFEERGEVIENIQHHSDNNNHDLSIKTSNSLNLNPESHKRGPKSTLASSYAELYKSKVTKLNWEQEKWRLEKEQKDKGRHMELTISEKEIQFAKDKKDKELEVRMLIADKDHEAMKLKEDNAMLLAVVGSSRLIEEIMEISKILFNR